MNNHISYRSGNPVLTSKAFNIQSDYTDKMTIEGRRPERRAPLKKSLVDASVRNLEVP